MDHVYCPGSKLLRQPKPESVSCSSCGTEVEIWSDEIKATCPGCGKTVFKDAGMGCLDWCKYGEECVGEEIYTKYRRNRAFGIRQKLLQALQEYFGEDRERLEHAQAVLAEAEKILAVEGGDPHIVVPAAILHDVGIKIALEKYGSADAPHQEREGPPVARKMLLAAGMKVEEIDEICAIIAHHHSPGIVDTPSFRAVYDGDCLVNLGASSAGKSAGELRSAIRAMFLTATGRERAEERYLAGAGHA